MTKTICDRCGADIIDYCPESNIITVGPRYMTLKTSFGVNKAFWPTDRQLAEVLDRKLRISYRGKKIRVILTGE